MGEVTPEGFCVYLIPETLRVTTMGSKQVGNTVNLEIETQTQVLSTKPEALWGTDGRCIPCPSRQCSRGMQMTEQVLQANLSDASMQSRLICSRCHRNLRCSLGF